MDHNTRSVVIDAIGSSVRALASFFARLNPFIRSGKSPIERMPNEIMQLIISKLVLNGDVTNLVRLRSVSTKWKALVEDYFEQKKSLIVVMDFQLQSYYDFEKRFFDFAKLKNFTRLFLVSKMPHDCLRSLLGMFSNIVQLSINCYDKNRVPTLVDYINSLDSLKQLDIVLLFVLPAANLSPTWSKLEHFSIYVGSLVDDERLQLISHLEPSCVRVYFRGEFTYDQIRQWHTNNPNWLANLTHLAIWVDGTSEDCAQAVHYLSEHATSIKLLNLTFTNRTQSLQMTPTLICDLSKLTNLAELELWNVLMDIGKLTQATAQLELTSIASVLNLKLKFLRLVGDGPISGGQFSRVLSGIFLNLGQLDLAITDSIANQHLTQQFEHEFEQYLNRFPKLRNHDINYF